MGRLKKDLMLKTNGVSFSCRHPDWRSRTAHPRVTMTTLPLTLSQKTQCMCKRAQGRAISTDTAGLSHLQTVNVLLKLL